MSDTDSYSCPACDTRTLEATQGSGIPFLRCTSCVGIFISIRHLTAYVDAESPEDDAPQAFLELLRTAIAQDKPDKTSTRHCIVCKKPLDRFGFGRRPFLIADRCEAHGLWLDDGDVEKVVRASRILAQREDLLESKVEQSVWAGTEEKVMVCPNCRRSFAGADAGDRCTDCDVVMFEP